MSNLTYDTVYWARIKRRGSNHKDRQYYYGLLSFEKYLEEHPSSVDVEVDEVPTRVSIISNKQDAFELTKKILSRVDTKIGPGSIVKWDEQHWIVYQRARQPNETYISCNMVRCNNQIKWIDKYGVQRQAYCHVVSSQDSQVKANFRTWHSMITPQPNQYLQILVPSNDAISLGQKFIIDDRAWFIVEQDKVSAPGITYYSLTEDKIDREDDDFDNKLANFKDKGKVRIQISDVIVGIDKTFILSPIIYDDGKVRTDLALEYIIDDEEIAIIQNGEIISKAQGQTQVLVRVADAPEINQTFVLKVEDESSDSYILQGPDSLRISQKGIYKAYALNEQQAIDPITSFEISDVKLITAKLDNGILIVTANEDNRLGVVNIIINTANKQYEKTVTIRSLW